MKKIKGGITSPKGFAAAGVAANIKNKNQLDMALIFSEKPCILAGTFTTNVVKAAPVIWDKNIVDNGNAVHAVVINSGIANACTKKEGLLVCHDTATYFARKAGILNNQVLIGSTGVIGKQIPIDKIKNGIDELIVKKETSLEAGNLASQAIMTTDTVNKEIAISLEIGGCTVTIGAMAKGSGMIHPNMCTMLSYLTTDANIDKCALQKILSEDVNNTYNMISVDGDTSTNDTVLLLANGAAGNEEIKYGSDNYKTFADAVHFVNEYLAKQIASDGEGATALLEASVIGASSEANAKLLAKSIVSSSLVKTALAGHDANWGRIICALGYSGATFDPERIDLFFESNAGKIQILKNSDVLEYSEEVATKILSEPEVKVIANIKQGIDKAIAWGCDLTHKYISINADYRS